MGWMAVRCVSAISRPVSRDPSAMQAVIGSSIRPTCPGPMPRTTCSQIGTKVTIPSSIAPTHAPIRSQRQIADCFNNPNGSSGLAARRSCRSNSQSAAAATAISNPTSGSDARSNCCARSSATSSGVMNDANRMTPRKSNCSRPPAPARRGSLSANTPARIPSGMLMRKTDRQPQCCVSQPPATGPKVDEATKILAR